MKTLSVAGLAILLAVASAQAQTPAGRHAVSQTDWPWWRGRNRDGIAAANQDPPISWSAKDNIRWRVAIPGRGHGSTTVLGNQVFLASADHERKKQVVLCFDRDSGKQKWEAIVHEGGFENKSTQKVNKKASLASSTVATDSS